MLRGRWPLSYECVSKETYDRVLVLGLKAHSLKTQYQRRRAIITIVHPGVRSVSLQHTFVWTDSSVAMMMVLMSVEPWLHSGDLCQVSVSLLRSLSSTLSPLESICCTSPLHCLFLCMSCINVKRVGVRELRKPLLMLFITSVCHTFKLRCVIRIASWSWLYNMQLEGYIDPTGASFKTIVDEGIQAFYCFNITST